MIRGIYTSATGMITQSKKMDVITNNIANIDTAGFKKDGVTTEPFKDVLTLKINDRSEIAPVKRIGKMNLGTTINKVYTNFSQGSLKRTDNSYDIAIEGDGFIKVYKDDGNGNQIERYTRDGSFVVSKEGQLLTKEGYYVAGKEGIIKVPEGDISINGTGDIFVDNQKIDRVELAAFEDNTTLRKIGNNLLKTTDQSKEKQFEGTLLQGFIEGSNVSSVREMVEMINTTKAYEINQKALKTSDEMLEKTVNQVGRL